MRTRAETGTSSSARTPMKAPSAEDVGCAAGTFSGVAGGAPGARGTSMASVSSDHIAPVAGSTMSQPMSPPKTRPARPASETSAHWNRKSFRVAATVRALGSSRLCR
jgi:hypothetical protein